MSSKIEMTYVGCREARLPHVRLGKQNQTTYATILPLADYNVNIELNLTKPWSADTVVPVYNKRTYYYLFSLIGRYILVEIGSPVTKPVHQVTMFPVLSTSCLVLWALWL